MVLFVSEPRKHKKPFHRPIGHSGSDKGLMGNPAFCLCPYNAG